MQQILTKTAASSQAGNVDINVIHRLSITKKSCLASREIFFRLLSLHSSVFGFAFVQGLAIGVW